ncbi:MAG: glucosamine-6-phosphate deaminase [bacterium]|nr:glucosamine-6-phosphate deaminase [bacterium]
MTNILTAKEERTVEKLHVKIYSQRADMGAAAARTMAEWMRETIADKGVVNVIFAAAPSQNEFLSTLAAIEDLDWGRVVAMHMDEYTNLSAAAPQGFGNFLAGHLWDSVKPGQVHKLDSTASDPQAECARYAQILKNHPADIVCGGIGENGHLAFNDPGVADFHDPLLVKVVELERQCRQQQVNDGCFNAIDEVPTHAMTVTIPALMAAPKLCCIVPGSTKANAVKATLNNPVSEACPATILRQHPKAMLFLEAESAALL